MSRNAKIILVPLFLYLIILISVLYIPQITTIDIKFIEIIQKLFGFIPPEVSKVISDFHYNWYKVILIVACIFLLYKKDYKLTALYVFIVLINKNITHIIKYIISRSRPPFELQTLYHPDSPSFHSGHSFSITILLGILIYLSCKHIKNKILKYTINTLCIIWILLVGLSRILLGVHYPTDVLAGYLLGIFFVYIVFELDNLKGKKNDN